MKLRSLILGVLASTLLFSQLANASFEDVKQGDPGFQGVSYLELQGAVDNGALFHPEKPVNRAEFFKMLFRLFGENGTDIIPSATFTDVPKNAWFSPFAELAIRYDLVDTSSRHFNPTQEVSRIDALNYLFKVYGLAAPIVPKDNRETLFNDIRENHPKYALIHRAVELGIVESNTKKVFRPYAPITRTEYADFLFKFDQWYVNQPTSVKTGVNGIPKPEILADIWKRILERFYVPTGMEIDEDVLFQAAVKGMLQSLNDPYSIYVPPTEASAFIESLTGQFEGIGTYLIKDEATGKLYVTGFVPGSDAQEKGMLVGDEIEEVDGVPVVDMSIDEASRRIRGPGGTTVTLVVRRNEQTSTYIIERRALTLENEKGSIMDNNIWYVDINSFTQTSFIDVNNIFVALAGKVPEPRAIVIDLRGNGGGYMDSALSIAGHFIPNSKPVVQLDYKEFVTYTYNSGKGEYYGKPLYVLVDRYSASASEILAAALQEQAKAKLVGETTFGKGTAQEVTQYWDGSILKITIAEWLSSEGVHIQGVGLTPDLPITGKSSTIDLWLNKVRQDLGQ